MLLTVAAKSRSVKPRLFATPNNVKQKVCPADYRLDKKQNRYSLSARHFVIMRFENAMMRRDNVLRMAGYLIATTR